MDEINRALEGLYSLLEQAESLALSRGARLRIVAIIGELEAALRKWEGLADDLRDVAPK